LGWFAHPVYSEDGDYPAVMKEYVAKHSSEEGLETSRLPQFTTEEINMIKGKQMTFEFSNQIFVLCLKELTTFLA
jgi:hypothetical protein